MFELIIYQLIFTKNVKDLQNHPTTLPLVFTEESLSNLVNLVIPFQQFLNIILPKNTL